LIAPLAISLLVCILVAMKSQTLLVTKSFCKLSDQEAGQLSQIGTLPVRRVVRLEATQHSMHLTKNGLRENPSLYLNPPFLAGNTNRWADPEGE